jgi:hypothetical protein
MPQEERADAAGAASDIFNQQMIDALNSARTAAGLTVDRRRVGVEP